jgi:RNA polymerase sigma-70 factor (ECF subfamily)
MTDRNGKSKAVFPCDSVPPRPEELSHASVGVEAFHQYRPLLISIAYRMLGSVADAEDIVQDAFIRWHEARRMDLRSPKAFLITIVSRLCIDHLKSARVRREEYVGPWLPEPFLTGTQDSLDSVTAAGESLSIAFLLMLERLNPMERAVFLLREIFDISYAELSGIVNLTEPACRQTLRRAKQHIANNRHRFSTSPQERNRLLREFMEAAAHGDLDRLLTLLHRDVELYADGGGKASALPKPIHGVDSVARFILRAPRKLLPRDLVRQQIEVNGQAAIISYLDGKPHSVFTTEIEDGKISNIYIISNPDKLSRMPDLPLTVPSS